MPSFKKMVPVSQVLYGTDYPFRDGAEVNAGIAAWGFSADTGAHYLRLVFAGIFDEFPKLKIILGHNGEGLPFVMERMNAHTVMDARRRKLKKTPLEYLRDHLMVTTSGNFSVPAFVGLGAPHWDAGARGLLCGITRSTSRAHLARAFAEEGRHVAALVQPRDHGADHAGHVDEFAGRGLGLHHHLVAGKVHRDVERAAVAQRKGTSTELVVAAPAEPVAILRKAFAATAGWPAACAARHSSTASAGSFWRCQFSRASASAATGSSRT